jgi:hypothetical protein
MSAIYLTGGWTDKPRSLTGLQLILLRTQWYKIQSYYDLYQLRKPLFNITTVFVDVNPCSLVEIYQHFGGTSYHHLYGIGF